MFYELIMENLKKGAILDSAQEAAEYDALGSEAGRAAMRLSRGFVQELKTNGYLENEPTPDEIGTLFARYTMSVARQTEEL
jgi:hypothetical protein